MDRFFPKNKLVFTGNPIRETIVNFKDKKEDGKKFFNINNNNITVLVVGGSLGSKTINESISQNLNLFKKQKLNLIWQTGVSFNKESNKLTNKFKLDGISSHVFIKEMDLAYAAADIIVSRRVKLITFQSCVLWVNQLF